MRIRTCLTLLASSLLVVACSEGGGGSALPADDLAGGDASEFSGSWRGDCVLEGEGYRTESIVIDGEQGSLKVRAYEDAACTQAQFEFDTAIEIDFGESIALPDGSTARAADIDLVEPVTLTALAATSAANLSGSEYCDVDDYAVDVSFDVSDCAAASDFAARVGQLMVQTLGIDTVDGERTLYLGDMNSDVVDATEPRPSVLKRAEPYVRVDS